MKIYNLALLLLLASGLQGQTLKLKSDSSLNSYIQGQYPPDNYVVSGLYYYRSNTLALGYPFLYTNNWHNGTVFFNNDSCSIKLLFDVEQNTLLTNTLLSDGELAIIRLDDQRVDSFYYHSELFISHKYCPQIDHGYLSLAHNSSNKVYVLYSKQFKENYSSSLPHGSYSELKRVIYLVADNKTLDITKRKQLLQHFSSLKSEIKSILRKHHISYGSISYLDLGILFSEIENL